MSESPDHDGSEHSVDSADQTVDTGDQSRLADDVGDSESGEDGSEPEEEDIDEEDDESDGGNGGFFDLEADESEDDAASNASSQGENETFSPFTRLPVELRIHIWSIFDPDLLAPTRVFSMYNVRHYYTRQWELKSGAFIENQTLPARTLLAVHQESRRLALTHYPDTMPFDDGRGLLPYNKEKDVISLTMSRQTLDDGLGLGPHLCKDIRNIAVHHQSLHDDDLYMHEFFAKGGVAAYKQALPHLETFFWETWGGKVYITEMQLISRFRGQFHVGNRMEDSDFDNNDFPSGGHLSFSKMPRGIQEEPGTFYAWADEEVVRDPAFAKLEDGCWLPPVYPTFRRDGVRVLPMIEFTDSDAVQFIKYGKPFGGPEHEDGEEGDDGSSGVDEYESDGIDDGPQWDDDLDGSSGDDLVVDDEDEEGIDDDDDDDLDGLMEGLEELTDPESANARFSSLEPDPDGAGEADHGPQRRQKRRRVVDSDTEDEDGVQPATEEEPNHTAKRQRRQVVDSDDEASDAPKEDGVRPEKRQRRRVVDSDDDDGDEEEASKPQGGSDRRGRPDGSASESEEDEEEDEEEEDEEEDDAKPPKMSLLQRLQNFRSDNPVPSDQDSATAEEESLNQFEDDDDAGSLDDGSGPGDNDAFDLGDEEED